MSVSTDERTTKRLVDTEFRPGELPAAEAVLRPDAGEECHVLRESRRPSLAAWLALGASAVILAIVVGNAAVSFATAAVRDGNVVDMILLAALAVLAGAIVTLLARQTQALRKLKSAERARAMAGRLVRLDSARSCSPSCRRSTLETVAACSMLDLAG